MAKRHTISGTAGDQGCDGWVAWTTSDDDYSCEATIRWGAHGIFVGVHEVWGYELSVIDEEGRGGESAPKCSISESPTRAEFVAKCVNLACEADAPNLQWVREAAGALFDAIDGNW